MQLCLYFFAEINELPRENIEFEDQTKIVNGFPAKSGEYPWQVSKQIVRVEIQIMQLFLVTYLSINLSASLVFNKTKIKVALKFQDLRYMNYKKKYNVIHVQHLKIVIEYIQQQKKRKISCLYGGGGNLN